MSFQSGSEPFCGAKSHCAVGGKNRRESHCAVGPNNRHRPPRSNVRIPKTRVLKRQKIRAETTLKYASIHPREAANRSRYGVAKFNADSKSDCEAAAPKRRNSASTVEKTASSIPSTMASSNSAVVEISSLNGGNIFTDDADGTDERHDNDGLETDAVGRRTNNTVGKVNGWMGGKKFHVLKLILLHSLISTEGRFY